MVLISFPGELEAAAVVAALTEQDIHATTTGSFTAGFQAEAPGQVSVVVKSSDLEAARQVLDKFELGGAEIDWSQVDVGEPEE
jgi:hypothetical protein